MTLYYKDFDNKTVVITGGASGLGKGAAKVFAKCPNCGKTAKNYQDTEKDFGFRNMDGIMRPQSWCRICRKK